MTQDHLDTYVLRQTKDLRLMTILTTYDLRLFSRLKTPYSCLD